MEGSTSQTKREKSELFLVTGPKGYIAVADLSNLLKMGHCAPAVMQTLLDLGNSKEEWLVRMTAGLPGGIGNTGFECGGITAPLIQMGLHHGLSAKHDGLPTVIYAGHDYESDFGSATTHFCARKSSVPESPAAMHKGCPSCSGALQTNRLQRQHRGYFRRDQGSLSPFVFSSCQQMIFTVLMPS